MRTPTPFIITADCWNGDNALVAPSSIASGIQNGSRGIYLRSPRRDDLGFAESGQRTDKVSILGLRESVCPSKIALFVIAVYVNAVKRVFSRWSISNFCQKRQEILKQKFNTTSAIIRIAHIFRILTTGFSVVVGFIFWRLTLTSVSVGFIPRTRFSLQTSTRLSSSRPQRCATYNRIFVAIAQTYPFSYIAIAFGFVTSPKLQHNQASEPLSGQVNKIRRIRFWGKSCTKIVINHWNKVHSFVKLVRVGRGLHNLYRPVFIIT